LSPEKTVAPVKATCAKIGHPAGINARAIKQAAIANWEILKEDVILTCLVDLITFQDKSLIFNNLLNEPSKHDHSPAIVQIRNIV
jgi:hypothetical protein